MKLVCFRKSSLLVESLVCDEYILSPLFILCAIHNCIIVAFCFTLFVRMIFLRYYKEKSTSLVHTLEYENAFVHTI